MKVFVPNRFSVVRVLRDDSHTKTFIATDHLLEKSNVVVKINRKGRSDRDYFTQRLSWFAGIRHDNLSTIFDAGLTTKGDLYCVREYLPTSELFSTESFVVIKALTSAIDFLQSHRQIHGAIKPSNIFFTNGNLKLSDPSFNNAVDRECEEDIRFAAPEILKGESPTLESDLHAVGAVLYRVLTRRNLFEDLDLTHLRAKYIWAVPQPIGNLCDVPKPVSDTVMQLLDKEPQKRATAFLSLKECVRAEPIRATRAPFIGRATFLNEALQFVRRPSTRSLRVLLIEGTAGIGKSRFVEELRTHCALEDFRFFVTHCDWNSHDFHPVLEAVRKLGEGLTGWSRDSFPDFVLERFQVYAETERNYLPGKLASDLVGAIASFARGTKLVLAIEDIEKANPATLQFLEQLAFRAAEVPMCLVITSRSGRSELKLSAVLSNCLGEEFRRIRLLRQTPGETQELAQYFEIDAERFMDLFQISGGNPLFIEEYAKRTLNPLTNHRAKAALDWMNAQLTKQTRAVAEILSLARKPVELEVIAKIIGRNIADLQHHINAIEHVGLIERNGPFVRIPYPGFASEICRNISHGRKLDLAKRIFEVFRETKTDLEDLAHYSFEAALFEIAADLFRQLAKIAFEQKNYRSAVFYYERLKQCASRCSVAFPPGDKLRLALCYQSTGEQTRARYLYEGLLSTHEIQRDPELLSDVYSALSGVLAKSPAEERVRLRHLAIECLPRNSPKLAVRYLELCETLLRVGHLSAAIDALDKAQTHVVSNIDMDRVGAVEASLLINQGDFRGAATCILRGEAATAVRSNNLALCFENLGDLMKALEFQLRAQKIAAAKGLVTVQVLSLSNIGSIKTKFGEMWAAERLFVDAIGWIERLQKPETGFDMGRFATVYCDAALHCIHTAQYKRAADHLKRIRPSVGTVFEQDRSYCGIVQCLFYREVGFTAKVRHLLKDFLGAATFKTRFFQVEHTLLEARMPDASEPEKLRRLEEALKITEQLGTLYQRCQVLNELAAVNISIGEKQKALEYSKSALQLADKQGYKLQEARALLLAGIASEKQKDKEDKLLDAFQSASEMGLQELVAESALHIGTLHLEAGNLVTAREYLRRSVSTTAKLSEEIPIRCRANYLAISWRRDARRGLEQCNQRMQQQSISATSDAHESFGDDRYFKATYRLALSAAAIKSAEALIVSIEETVKTSLAHGAVILLNGPTGPSPKGSELNRPNKLWDRFMMSRQWRRIACISDVQKWIGRKKLWRGYHCNPKPGRAEFTWYAGRTSCPSLKKKWSCSQSSARRGTAR